MILHLCSYANDSDESEANSVTNKTTDGSERIRKKLEDDPQFMITGTFTIILLLTMTITSIKRLQVALNFMLFYILHFISSVAIYLLMFTHGSNYVNTQFWKWLIPITFILIFELLHRYYSHKVQKVNVMEACTTGDIVIYRVAKPHLFKFVPGQFLSVNLPDISYIGWNHCQILSAPSDKVM